MNDIVPNWDYIKIKKRPKCLPDPMPAAFTPAPSVAISVRLHLMMGILAALLTIPFAGPLEDFTSKFTSLARRTNAKGCGNSIPQPHACKIQ